MIWFTALNDYLSGFNSLLGYIQDPVWVSSTLEISSWPPKLLDKVINILGFIKHNDILDIADINSNREGVSPNSNLTVWVILHQFLSFLIVCWPVQRIVETDVFVKVWPHAGIGCQCKIVQVSKHLEAEIDGVAEDYHLALLLENPV